MDWRTLQGYGNGNTTQYNNDVKQLLDESEEKLDIDMTESELEDQCDELFKVAPIEFRPRKFNQIDQVIANIIDEKDIVIPILHI